MTTQIPQMPKKKVNFPKILQSRFNLRCYLLKSDKRHYFLIIAALASLGIAIVSLAVSGATSFAIVTFILTLILSLANFTIPVAYKPNQWGRELIEKSWISRTADGLQFTESIVPPASERAEGFEKYYSKSAQEIAFFSPDLDNWLSEQPGIEIKSGDSSEVILNKGLADDTMKAERLKFLYSAVRKNKATNELKYTIDKIPYRNCLSVEVKRVGYYDALVTNQCVGKQLLERPRNARASEGKIAANFSLVFPRQKEFKNGQQLDALTAYSGGGKLAHSVGITTLVITADKFPVFLSQRDDNVEGAGKWTLLGSGSADFADTENVETLIDAVRYGMIREAMEEGSLDIKKNAQQIWNEAYEKTMILGFFRWVSRGGKPEFVGVTKLGVKLDDIKPEKREVAPLTPSGGHPPISISSMSDFQSLIKAASKQSEEHRGGNPWIGLSSVMAIRRLAEISKEPESSLNMEIAAMLDIDPVDPKQS